MREIVGSEIDLVSYLEEDIVDRFSMIDITISNILQEGLSNYNITS